MISRSFSRSFGFFAALALLAVSQASWATESDIDLSDLISPDEIAEELGLSTEEDGPGQSSAPAPKTRAEKLKEIFGEVSSVPNQFRAELFVRVSKAASGPGAQKLTVYRHGIEVAQWDVSTGRERWENAKSGRRYFSVTPVGFFRPTKLDKAYWSKTWKAYMKNAIFLIGGIAIHATTPDHYKELGTRASGGCIRLRYEHSKTLFDWVSAMEVKQVPRITRTGGDTTQTIRNRDVLVMIDE